MQGNSKRRPKLSDVTSGNGYSLTRITLVSWAYLKSFSSIISVLDQEGKYKTRSLEAEIMIGET